MNRRQFLTAFGALCASTMLPKPARAQGVAKKLIVLFASGGWDTTYLFDAKPDSPFVDTGQGDWAPFGNGALWLDPGRPAVKAFFDEYGSITSIINGVNVPSVAHGSCTQRLLTGSRDSRKPDIAAIIGHESDSSLPMPYLDIGGSARPGILGADMGYLGENNQISGLVRRQNAPRPSDPDTWSRYFATEDEYDRVQAYVERRAGRSPQRSARGENNRRYQAFLSGLRRSHQLRNFDDFFANVGRGRGDFETQARIGVEALQANLSRSVFLSVNSDFDTHANNDDQITQYNNTFGALKTLVDLLASTPGTTANNMLDETVIMLASEMGRTPRRNAQDGKDHWPITSSLVLGAGIKGNQIIGATDDTLASRNIDLATGNPVDSGGVVLQPEHIHSALLELFGIDAAQWFPQAPALRGLHG